MKSVKEERKKIAMKLLIRAALRLIEKRRKSKKAILKITP